MITFFSNKYDIENAEKKKQSKNEKEEVKNLITAMELRLRSSIKTHGEFLNSITIDREVSFRSFVDQLKSNAKVLDNPSAISESKQSSESFISLVSIDVNREEVRKILSNAITNYSPLADYFKRMSSPEAGMEWEKRLNEKQPHVTMAHFSRSSQNRMRSDFGSIVGMKVKLRVNGILYSDKVAALSVILPETTTGLSTYPLPSCENDFPHITVWCAHNVKAFESNCLPDNIKNSFAKKIVFDDEFVIDGVVSYWYQ